MKFSILALAMAVMANGAMAYELHCKKDFRAVDGDSVTFDLVVDENTSRATSAVFQEDGGGMTVEFHNTTKLLALSCKKGNGPFLNITCTGPGQNLSVSDLEAVGPGGQGFTHVVTVSTNVGNRNLSFGGQSPNSPSTPNFCTTAAQN